MKELQEHIRGKLLELYHNTEKLKKSIKQQVTST